MCCLTKIKKLLYLKIIILQNSHLLNILIVKKKRIYFALNSYLFDLLNCNKASPVRNKLKEYLNKEDHRGVKALRLTKRDGL